MYTSRDLYLQSTKFPFVSSLYLTFYASPVSHSVHRQIHAGPINPCVTTPVSPFDDGLSLFFWYQPPIFVFKNFKLSYFDPKEPYTHYTRHNVLEEDLPLFDPLPAPTRPRKLPTPLPLLPLSDDNNNNNNSDSVMASKIASAFNSPLMPTIYASMKSEKTPDLDVQTKIRLVGTQLHELSMATWWNANWKEFLKLSSWDLLEKQIRNCFMPKGYKLIPLCTFFLCAQGNLTFAEYAATLAEAHNAVGPSIISASIYKYQLLFHTHPILVLHIVAIPDFDIDNINFDDLSVLMSMQYESLSAEGNLGRLSITSCLSSTIPAVPHLPFLDDTECECLSNAKGCWRCHKIPTDNRWVPHVGHTCPGNAANGVSPGHDFVPAVKRELAGAVMVMPHLSLSDLTKDQLDYEEDSNTFYGDEDTDSN